MTFLRLMIVSFITIEFLTWFTNRNDKKTKQRSQKKFVVKAPTSFIFLGTVDILLVLGVLIGAKYTGEVGFRALYINICCGLVAIPGFMLLVAPIKGIWDVRVNDDEITVVKLFVFKKHFLFSKVVRMKQTRGGYKVYVEGRKRMAFFIDAMNDGANLFFKRADKQGVDIEMMKFKEE